MPSPVRGKHIKLTQMFCPIHCLTPGSSGFWVQRGPCFLQFVTEYLYQSQNANENHFWHTLRAMWNVIEMDFVERLVIIIYFRTSNFCRV